MRWFLYPLSCCTGGNFMQFDSTAQISWYMSILSGTVMVVFMVVIYLVLITSQDT